MKIIINPPTIFDIEDYAVWRGTLDAIRESFSPSLFSFSSEIASELQALYETAYLMEKESKAFEMDCDFEVKAIIHTYNDATGWGKIFSEQFIGLLDFCYSDLTWDDFVEQGEHIILRFKKLYDGKIKILKITRST